VDRRRLRVLADNAEDISLAIGTLLVGLGSGAAYGWPYGLMAVGVLAVAYGVWITERR